MARVAKAFFEFVRSVVREKYIEGTTDPVEAKAKVLADPRIVGFSPLLIQIAIEIVITLVRYWLSKNITIPSVRSNDLEPFSNAGDLEAMVMGLGEYE
jgi:hypothetical protein